MDDQSNNEMSMQDSQHKRMDNGGMSNQGKFLTQFPFIITNGVIIKMLIYEAAFFIGYILCYR